MRRKNSQFSRSFSVLLIRVGGAALQLILVALAVALFPVHDVGQNAILWSAAIMARVGGTLGLDLYILRELPSLWEDSQAEFGLRSKGILQSLLWVLIPVTILLFAGGIWLDSIGSLDIQMAYAIPLVVFASALQRLWSCQLRARGQLMLGQTLDAIVLPSAAIGFLIASHTWAPHLFIAGQCASIVLLSAVMSALLRSDFRQKGKQKRLTRRDWKQVVPLGAGSGLSVLSSRAPIMFVGAASITQAASYEIGQRIHSAATLASASATAVLFPRVKGHIKRGDTRQLLRELVSAVFLGVIPALFILIGLLLAGPERTQLLMGPEYAGAWATAIVLAAAACVNSVTGLCHGVLAMAGSGQAFWIIAAVQASITLVYGVFYFDGVSVHMATFALIMEIGRGIVLLVLTRRLLKSISMPMHDMETEKL
ncbi:lipopolysaccharide biosynthesis protein [Arthrobacter sp. NPDC097144]|uniref:lipopolysaccharide biosynthesis protein n=1 Tax=Arthrobacter sp. NPDC097144 TaxID=3363946 RepID=UPI0037FD6292